MNYRTDTVKFNNRLAQPIIRYSQSWEDPRVLLEALSITTDDDVLSIAAAGDNTFALLLNNPRSLTAVDSNPAQIVLTELKIKGIEHLDYAEFVEFVGARRSAKRQELYHHVRPWLTQPARSYWDTQSKKIAGGIIHCGKFERYFSIFRRFVLPLIHNKDTVRRLLTPSKLEEQQSFYRDVWNNRCWRALFHIFFGKFLLGSIGRDPSFFQFVRLDKVAGELLKRTEHGFMDVPLRDNYFLEFIMTGEYRNLDECHPYLEEKNFSMLKDRVHKIRLHTGSLQQFLSGSPDGAMSKFNLSDIFEYMPDEDVEHTIKQLARTGRRDSRLAFWTLFVPRVVPSSLQHCIRQDSQSATLHEHDRTFFYGSFASWLIKPGCEGEY